MRIKMKFILGLLTVALLVCLTGCGQTGPLYLPGDKPSIKTTI